MIGTAEVVSSLEGALRLARGDAGGMACFNRSLEGFWRSFFAAIIAAPAYMALAAPVGEGASGDLLRPVLVDAIAYVIGWVAFPLAMTYVAAVLQREDRYLGYIVAYNWAQVPQAFLYLTGAIMVRVFGIAEPLNQVLGVTVLGAILVYTWFVARTALEITRVQAVGLVGLDIGLTIVIGTVAAALKAGVI
ncbi:MAG: hypothetical protein WCF16_12540 [Alphaproteobacteria bacterium]